MTAIDKGVLKDAVSKRTAYILENKETITMNECRKILEEDLGLPEKSLRSEKAYVKELIEAVMSSAVAEEPKAPSQACEQEAQQDSEEAPAKHKKAEAEIGEDGEPLRKKLKTKEKKIKKKNESKSQEEKPQAGKEYGQEVQKLKRICKSATITVPPSVYTRVTEEQDVVDRLKALLQKHGLSEHATSDEIAQVRKDLQKQRDLDGIDTSNILSVGRGRRAAAAVPCKYSYENNKDFLDSNTHDEKSDDDNAKPANVSPGSLKQQQKVAKALEVSEASDSDGQECSDDEASSQPSNYDITASSEGEDSNMQGVERKASASQCMKKRHFSQWSDDDE
ncbi:g6773 [Coccomyxa elongata]